MAGRAPSFWHRERRAAQKNKKNIKKMNFLAKFLLYYIKGVNSMKNEQTTDTLQQIMPFGAGQAAIPLDYADSTDAFEIDRGIRNSIRGIQLSILAMGIALANLKAGKLFIKLGYRNISAYITHLSGEYRMDRSTIHNWLYIGEAYIKYRSELEQIGFHDGDGPAKLYYLDRAIAVNNREEVFQTLKDMTVKEFASYAKGEKKGGAEDDDSTRWIVAEKGNSFYVNGKLAIIISSKMNKKAAAYFKKVIRTTCEALENEGHILPVFLKSRRDVIRFAPEVERLKRQMKLG